MAGVWKEILDSDMLGTPNGIAQLDSAGLLNNSQIPAIPVGKLTGTLSVDNIPNLSASKITSGTITAARIPSLDASKISSGTFSADRIPTLSQSKISGLSTVLSGKVDTSRKVNGKALTSDISLKSTDIIEKVATLPLTGVAGELVTFNDKLYVWVENK